MKKLKLLLSLFILGYHLSYSQSQVLESQNMSSNLLKDSIKYSIYLPDGYDDVNSKYPIIYLLNGRTGDEMQWLKYGNLKATLDSGIYHKHYPPMIVVMPDGDDRVYMNKADGTYPYEDMLIEEFIPFIESTYKVNNSRKNRAISGLSMGGAGALKLAMTYPDLFIACAAYSPAIRTDEEMINYEINDQSKFDNYYGRALGAGLKGKERLTDHFRKNNVFDILKNTEPEKLKSVAFYFDVGFDDYLSTGNAQLHIDLKSKGIPHEFWVRAGEHTWPFWSESLPQGIAFIVNSFLDN